ncbi:DEKNAAC100249 [Brettanomyces naardenensis]|uniref:DNA helicase n=1 Tax=Brettanomyces naardenensis TaxID=13370 RepID=A0A448YF11_BRENA|nr:DEKNAAC100249 [Brettanomyces naardenensis]
MPPPDSSFYDLGKSRERREEGKDDGRDDKSMYDIHQGIIFAIHLTPTMYKNLPTIFDNLLFLIHDLAKSLPNTGLGCYLFNCSNEVTDRSDSESIRGPEWRKQLLFDRKGIYPIFKLNDINANQLKTIDNLFKQSQVGDEFFNDNPHSFDKVFQLLSTDPVKNYGEQLSSILNQCQDDFTYIPKYVKPYTSRRIFLFTDCDKPFNGSTSIRTTLQHNIHDLNTARIGVIPFLFASAEGKEFDLKEYKILLEVGESGEFAGGKDAVGSSAGHRSYIPSVKQISLEKIREKISKTKEIKRTAFACPLVFNEKLRISIKGYALFSELKLRLPDSFYDDEGVYKLVHTKTVKLTKSTGEIIPEDKIVKAFHIGDQYFNMDRTYYDKLLQFNESQKPILRILGFRDIQYFNPSYTIGTPVFVVPDEDGEYSHSRRTFSALYQSLTRRRKMCLAWGMPRLLSYPSLYYLIPTDESLGFKTNTDNYPQGLALIEIPYSDQIRMLPSYLTEQVEPTATLIPNKFDNLLEKLRARFVSLENPQLTWYFKVFEDFLLQREAKEPQIKIEGDDSGNTGSEALEKQIQVNATDQLKGKVMELRSEVMSNSEMAADFKAIRNQLNRISNFEELHPKKEEEEKPPPSKRNKLLTDDIVIKAWKLDEMSRFSAQQLRVYINSKPNLIERANTKSAMIKNIAEYLDRAVT